MRPEQPEVEDKPDFAELWVNSQHALGAFVRLHLRDHGRADDIIQEVARQATANFDQYDPARPFIAWLIGIARQRMAEMYRKQNREPILFSNDVLDSLANAYREMQGESSDRMEGLRRCMSKLSDRHRRVIELRYARQLGSQEIAEMVGGNAGSVDVMMHRIRVALRDCISTEMERLR